MKMATGSYLLLAVGAVAALVFSAGPLGSSRLVQGLFAASIVCLLAGAFLRRVTGHRDAFGRNHGDELCRITAAMETLVRHLNRLVSIAPPADVAPSVVDEFFAAVSAKTTPPMEEFLKCRQVLRDGVGFGSFAEVMIAFAGFERWLNRCISAAADNETAEALYCLGVAQQRMSECSELLRKLDLPTSPSSPQLPT